jgi:biotin transport system substrate-specific component
MSSVVSTPGSRVLGDLIPGARVRDVALVLGGTAILTVAGQVAIPLPFTPVPLSLATFAVLVIGASLGPVRAAASAILYLLLGLVGLPIFAEHHSGWMFASFGYVLGYVAAAVIVGLLARRRADRGILGSIGLGALGSLAIYACGVPWLMAMAHVDLATALALGVLPFLIGDAIKIVATALILPATWKLVDRSRQA